jgi:hypothetical protein
MICIPKLALECLSKLASKSIEKSFQHANINFEKHTLKNSLALKRNFESMDLQRDNITIISLDIKDMYPQCRFKAVKAAIRHYSSRLPPLQQEKAKQCLDILEFSMGNTIVSFRDKYYEYGVDPDPNRRGLTIGSFESAFLADLEATYIFEKLHRLLEQHVRFIGTYYNDEIILFWGNRLNEWLKNWLSIFQKEVDRLLGNVDIQFTMEIWRPGQDLGSLLNSSVSIAGIGTFHTVSINGDRSFLYLDIKLSWNKDNTLLFNVHRKPDKLVKYLNLDSHHHRHHKTAVLSGVKLRLALLTTRTPANANLSLLDIYPDKDQALQLARQLKLGQKMQTLSAVLNDKTSSGPDRLKKQSHAFDKRDSFLIVKYASLGHSQWLIVKVVKHLRNLCCLKWLHLHVVFSRHTNLQEKLLRNLQQNVLWGVADADFGPRPCNSPRQYKVNEKCAYGGECFTCQTAGSVYKISCNVPNCNCFYVGKSQ